MQKLRVIHIVAPLYLRLAYLRSWKLYKSKLARKLIVRITK